MSAFLEAVASVLVIYAEGNVFTQLLRVCACLCEAGGADAVCSAARGGFRAFPLVLATPMRAPVKDTVNRHRNMWV